MLSGLQSPHTMNTRALPDSLAAHRVEATSDHRSSEILRSSKFVGNADRLCVNDIMTKRIPSKPSPPGIFQKKAKPYQWLR